ncbi:hypothetical protein niasHT_016276 [Heterodera trifolii]|uniref:Uncharacterized protein n=1 Tax=Heterodera trifolii TaxID=157864 RepID=A0ABD2LHE3_9BILA
MDCESVVLSSSSSSLSKTMESETNDDEIDQEEQRNEHTQAEEETSHHQQKCYVAKCLDSIAKLQRTFQLSNASADVLDRAADYMQLYLDRYANGKFGADWVRRMLFIARIHGAPLSRLRFIDVNKHNRKMAALYQSLGPGFQTRWLSGAIDMEQFFARMDFLESKYGERLWELHFVYGYENINRSEGSFFRWQIISTVRSLYKGIVRRNWAEVAQNISNIELTMATQSNAKSYLSYLRNSLAPHIPAIFLTALQCSLETKCLIEQISDEFIEICSAFRRLPIPRELHWMDDSLLFLSNLLIFHLVNLRVTRRSESGGDFLSSYIRRMQLHNNAERHRVIMLLSYCLEVEREVLASDQKVPLKFHSHQLRSYAVSFSNFLRTLFDEPKSSVGLLPLAVWGAVRFGCEEELADYMLDASTKYPHLLVHFHGILSRFRLERISGKLFERLFDLSLDSLATSPVLLDILEQRSIDPTGFGVFDNVVSQNLKALFMFLDFGRHRTDVRAWAFLYTNLCYLRDNAELMKALLLPLWLKRRDWWPRFHSVRSLQKKISDSANGLPRESSTVDCEIGKDESRDEGKLESERLHFKRIRHYDSDRTIVDYSLDMPKIIRYFMAVKNSRARSIYRIVEEEKPEQKNVAWIGEGQTAQWRKVDESELDGESSISRWMGSQSVELEVRGSVPADFKGFSFKKPSGRKAVEKEPKKRGRPRINPQPAEDAPAEPRKPRGRPPKVPLAKFEKPITLNERLHSLVDESIAQRSLSEKKNDAVGRRTNNSLNVYLEMGQQQTNVVTPKPFRIPKKIDKTLQQNVTKISLPTFKRPKVEPSDFELPANFLDTVSVPPPPNNSSHFVRPSSQRNSFQWASDRPCTSSSLAREGTFSGNKSKSSLDNFQIAKSREISENQTEREFATPQVTNGSTGEEKKRNERRKGEADKALDQRSKIRHDEEANANEVHSITGAQPPTFTRRHDEEANANEGHSAAGAPLSFTVSARLPIFTARTFTYEVDVAPAVAERFESAQVVDIFNSLPPPIDPRTKRENANGISGSVPTPDRLILRQGKCRQRIAQVFFCGGPLSALAICPRATRKGRELIAIGTFADEKMLKMESESQDAFVQLWTTNPKNPNEMARFECLLRVPKAQHICSLNWCPIFDDEFESFRTLPRAIQRLHNSGTPSTSRQSFTEFTKESLGLLAVGTHSGGINIYSVPSEIESLVEKFQSRDANNSLPCVFESDAMFSLAHPPMSDDSTLNGDKSTKDETSKADERTDEATKTTLEPSSGVAPHPSIPLLCLNWSPFSGGRRIAAVSPIGHVFIWDLTRPARPTWKLHFDDWNSPPQSICWTEKDKIAISFRRRLFRIYGLVPPTESDQFGLSHPVLECDLNKTCGAKCCSQPLIFPGLISYESSTFSYFGITQQAPSYIWVTSSPDDESEKDQICATTLSNCHQIQNTCVSVCQLSGLCVSVGADGRMACSLNGRMAPNGQGDGENLMQGRTLLHLIMHDKSIAESEDNNKNFCFSHNECCTHRRLEVRLGDCALMDQENERICRRRAPEVCPGRRLEALTFCEFSRKCVGLTYCGGESGLVFVVPCTL